MTHALDDLLEALEDVDDATREEAAKTLAELGDPKGLEALVSACSVKKASASCRSRRRPLRR
jgi:HEAT repeat protein